MQALCLRKWLGQVGGCRGDSAEKGSTHNRLQPKRSYSTKGQVSAFFVTLFSLRSCKSSSVNFFFDFSQGNLENLVGNLEGIFRDFRESANRALVIVF